MFSKKKQVRENYQTKVKFLAEKILWLKEHYKINALLLTDIDEQHNYELIHDLHTALGELNRLNIAMTPLLANKAECETIDWDHDLNILYLNDVSNNQHLPAISKYVDYSLLLIRSSSSSRHKIAKGIKVLSTYKITLSACILHQFKEKVPNLLKRIFF